MTIIKIIILALAVITIIVMGTKIYRAFGRTITTSEEEARNVRRLRMKILLIMIASVIVIALLAPRLIYL